MINKNQDDDDYDGDDDDDDDDRLVTNSRQEVNNLILF